MKTFLVEFDRESDGRWIAEISDLPGVLAYGGSRNDAAKAVEVLALRVIADRLERDESEPLGQVSFTLSER